MKQQRKIHIKPSYIILGVILTLLAAFCIRVAVWEHNYFARMEGSERASSGAYIDGQDVDEEKPDSTAIAEYEVAPDKPRYLTIRSLGIINARIVEVGLKENQELATPVNIYDIGWYTGSDLPGTGVSVMDAHGGNAGQGIFRTLPNIQTGAEIAVEMGDGRLYTYVVTDTATKALGDESPPSLSSPALATGGSKARPTRTVSSSAPCSKPNRQNSPSAARKFLRARPEKTHHKIFSFMLYFCFLLW